MKKLLFILLVLASCKKMDIPKPITHIADIFSVSQSSVIDGQDIHFNLQTAGMYTLTLINKTNNQVVSRERFTGKVGENTLKLYTNTLSVKTLYLLLENNSKVQIGKTIVITN
jgi:hypothetical protein